MNWICFPALGRTKLALTVFTAVAAAACFTPITAAQTPDPNYERLLDAIGRQDLRSVKGLLQDFDLNKPAPLSPPAPPDPNDLFGRFRVPTEGELWALRTKRIREEHTRLPLHTAVWLAQTKDSEDSTRMLSVILDAGADINAQLPANDKTPLHLAVEKGNQELVDFLLSKGAKFDLPNSLGETPLHVAAKEHHEQIFRSLIQKGADVDATTANGRTTLHMLAETQYGHRLFEELVGADVKMNINATDNVGESALSAAVASGSLPMVRRLLQLGVEVDTVTDHDASPVTIAVKRGQIEQLDLAHQLADLGVFKQRPFLKTNDKFDEHIKNVPDHIRRVFLLKAGEETFVRFFLQRGVDPNLSDAAGNTPLHLLVGDRSWPNELALVALLKNGANPNLKNKAGDTPFSLAKAHNHYVAARVLAEFMKPVPKVDPLTFMETWQLKEYQALKDNFGAERSNRPNEGGVTPLRSALDRRNPQVVELILSYGAKVAAEDVRVAVANRSWLMTKLLLDAGGEIATTGHTPLHIAVENGDFEIAQLLLDHGGKAAINATYVGSNSRGTPLDLAIHKGDPAMVRLLIQHGANPNGRKNQVPPLVLSLKLDRQIITDFLLEQEDLDVNATTYDGISALHVATTLERTKQLLEMGASVKATGQHRSVLYSSVNKSPEIVKVLVEHGADVNYQQEVSAPNQVPGTHYDTPLHHAVGLYPESLETVQYLIDQGADLAARNQYGETPLHTAVQRRASIRLVSLLLDNGADIDALDGKPGWTQLTPLSHAIWQEADVARVLLERGAKTSYQDLYQACSRKQPQLAQQILAKGIDPNNVDHNDSPLHHAVRQNEKALVEQLLARGADRLKKNKDGKTPLDLANATGDAEIIRLMTNTNGVGDATP